MKRVVFKKINSVEIDSYELGKLDCNCFRLRHLYSLISSGTELLCLTGKMGEFSDVFPGYSAVGELIDGYEGSPYKKGDLFFTNGAHTEVVDIPKASAAEILVPIDREHLVEATFLPLGKVALHGLKRINVQLGDWVVVYGLGIVGNLAAQLSKVATGGKVIAVDPVKSRRDIAESLGIITFDPLSDGYVEKIMEITKGGANAIIETSGSPSALNEAFKIASYDAKISLVAGHYGTRQVDLKTDFQNKEISLIAARRVDNLTRPSCYDRWTVFNYSKEIYEMIIKKTLKVRPLISHVTSPEEAPKKYLQLAKGDESVLGVIIDWTKQEGNKNEA